MTPRHSRPSRQHRHAVLVSVDGVSGRALAAAAQGLKADGHQGAGISEWDASGIFGDLAAADDEAGAPSARVLLLLYAADLAFRLRWEIRPTLAKGRTVIAAPYVDTAVAFGRAAGVPGGWLRNLFSFALEAAESHHLAPSPPAIASASRTTRPTVAIRSGFLEFACERVAGTGTGLSRQALMDRARAYLKTAAGRRR